MTDPVPAASMTGSGGGRGATGLGPLRIEVRSVNGRGLAVRCRLAPECQGLEPLVEKRIRKRLHRGTIQVTIDCDTASVPEPFQVDARAARRVHEVLVQLAADLGTTGGVTLRDVLSVTGVVVDPACMQGTAGEIPAGFIELVDGALDALVADRLREGGSTVAAMIGLVADLEKLMEKVRGRAPHVIAEHRRRLLERVNEFLEGQARTLEDGDVIREVALFAERVDVSEELQRLGEHISKLRSLLAGGGVMGRQLEFLLQEMLREANTLGSKCSDVAMTHVVVELKTGIDRLKEQAANLE